MENRTNQTRLKTEMDIITREMLLPRSRSIMMKNWVSHNLHSISKALGRLKTMRSEYLATLGDSDNWASHSAHTNLLYSSVLIRTNWSTISSTSTVTSPRTAARARVDQRDPYRRLATPAVLSTDYNNTRSSIALDHPLTDSGVNVFR